jgi:hypothetical protein
MISTPYDDNDPLMYVDFCERMRTDGHNHIDETFDSFHDDKATRIYSACHFWGEEDRYIVQYYRFPGSVVRSTYDKHTTETVREWIPVRKWQYDKLVKMYDAETQCYSI